MINFSKMERTGNDFIIINTLNQRFLFDYNNLSKFLCNRNFGIGANGVIFIERSSVADVKMRIFNSNGSEAEMCGNGITCLGKYLFEKQIILKKDIFIETLSGIKKIELTIENKTVISIKVNMGKPSTKKEHIPIFYSGNYIKKLKLQISNQIFTLYPVSMGNPHCVCFVKQLNNIDINKIGPIIENYKYFPKKTNVEFVQIINKNTLNAKIWERGVGETLSCGTGACAIGYISYINNFCNNNLTINLPGGKLKTLYNTNSSEIFLIGDCKFVFDGFINI